MDNIALKNYRAVRRPSWDTGFRLEMRDFQDKFLNKPVCDIVCRESAL